MFVKVSVLIFLQALLIQASSAQCSSYNGYTTAEALTWPAASSLAWDGGMGWPCSNNGMGWSGNNPFAWEATANAGPEFAANYATASWAFPPYETTMSGLGYSPATLSASNGGGLAISSASPITPSGVSMSSDNIYEGQLAVSGGVPFLSAVALEGYLPTGGAGSVAYGCGNGNVAMLNEDYASGYNVGSYGYSPMDTFGYNAGPYIVEAGIAPMGGYNSITGAGPCRYNNIY